MSDEQPIMAGQVWERIKDGRRVEVRAFELYPTRWGGDVLHRPEGAKRSGSWCWGTTFRQRYKLIESVR